MQNGSIGPTESDPSYYGWRVVLAACFGVMAGFGSLFDTPAPHQVTVVTAPLALSSFVQMMREFGVASGRGNELLRYPFITVTIWAADQVLAKPLHLYGCFFYLLSIFVASLW